MANLKISDAVEKTTLDGSEVFPASSAGNDRKISVDSINSYTEGEISTKEKITTLNDSDRIVIGIGGKVYNIVFSVFRSLVSTTIALLSNLITLYDQTVETISGIPTTVAGALEEIVSYVKNLSDQVSALAVVKGQITYPETTIKTTETTVAFTETLEPSNTDVFDYDTVNYYVKYYLNANYNINSVLTLSNNSTSTAHTFTINAYSVDDEGVETLLLSTPIVIAKSTTEKLYLAEYVDSVTDAPKTVVLKFVSTSDTDVVMNSYVITTVANDIEGYSIGDTFNNTEHRENVDLLENKRYFFNGINSNFYSEDNITIPNTFDTVVVKIKLPNPAEIDSPTDIAVLYSAYNSTTGCHIYCYYSKSDSGLWFLMQDSNGNYSYYVFNATTNITDDNSEAIVTFTGTTGNIVVTCTVNGETPTNTGSSSSAVLADFAIDDILYLARATAKNSFFIGYINELIILVDDVEIVNITDFTSTTDNLSNSFVSNNVTEISDPKWQHNAGVINIDSLGANLDLAIGKGDIKNINSLPTVDIYVTKLTTVTFEQILNGLGDLNGQYVGITLATGTHSLTEIVTALKRCYNGTIVFFGSTTMTSIGSDQTSSIVFSGEDYFDLTSCNVNVEFRSIKFVFTSTFSAGYGFQVGGGTIRTYYCCYILSSIADSLDVFSTRWSHIICSYDLFIGSTTQNTQLVRADYGGEHADGTLLEVFNCGYGTASLTSGLSGRAKALISNSDGVFASNVSNGGVELGTGSLEVTQYSDFVVYMSDNTTDLTTDNDIPDFPIGRNMTLNAIKATVLTAPVGSDLIIDILVDSTSIGTITITAGTTTATTTFDDVINAGSSLNFDLTAVGATTPGAGLNLLGLATLN